MDSSGWIPISLIASFNRVRQLTMDVQLVRDVLILSSVVQVKDDWVRMGSWEQFVLPDAAASPVEAQEHAETPMQTNIDEKIAHVEVEHGFSNVDLPASDTREGEEDEEVDADGDLEDDDDDEDVVFVMNSEVAGSGLTWSPEKHT
jgi:la-related protein 1